MANQLDLQLLAKLNNWSMSNFFMERLDMIGSYNIITHKNIIGSKNNDNDLDLFFKTWFLKAKLFYN